MLRWIPGVFITPGTYHFKISVVANLNIQTVPNKKCQLIASKIRIAPDFIGWVKTLVQMKSWNLFKGICNE